MCLVIVLMSIVVVHATVFVDMNTVNDYINGTGAYVEGGGGGRHRWTGDLTVKMRLAVAAFALAQGVVFDNPSTSNAILDFYNGLSETDKKKIHAISELLDNVEDAYNVIATVSKDVADYMTNLISSFFTHEKYFSSSGSVDYGQSVSYNGNSNVDLTLADQIFLTTQTAADPSPNNHDCHVDYRIASGFVLRAYYHSYSMPIDIWPEFANLTPNSSNYSILVPDDGDLCAMSYASLSNNTVYSNLAFKFSDYQLTFKSVSNDTLTFTFVNNSCFYSKSMFNSSTYITYRIGELNGKYAYLDRNYSAYKSLTFDTKTDAVNYFLQQGGMSITEPFAVEEAVSSNDVLEIDEDKQTQFITQISNMSDDDVITIVFPTTNTYNTFANDPSRLFDFSQDNLYDAPVDLPVTSGNKLATKFPFCIPFDIINLFSGFVSEPECPSFHLLIMPADSFGLDNEDIYWDLDFSNYNYLVQLLRFFIAVAFVFWLISITKRIIK